MQAACQDRIHGWMIAYGTVAMGGYFSMAFLWRLCCRAPKRQFSVYIVLVGPRLYVCEVSVWSSSRVAAKVCLPLGKLQRGAK
jgi:hypothetical protein